MSIRRATAEAREKREEKSEELSDSEKEGLETYRDDMSETSPPAQPSSGGPFYTYAG